MEAGADAIGLIFYPPSSRFIDVETAIQIVSVVRPFGSVVGVFADQTSTQVEQVVNNVELDLLQFHGDETPSFCQSFKRPWLKGIRMHPDLVLKDAVQAFAGARGVLVDTWKSGAMGGTGSGFDWSRLEGVDRDRLILAGGLRAANVRSAIESVQPAAIDVSSSVELEPGIKSKQLIDEFVNAARSG